MMARKTSPVVQEKSGSGRGKTFGALIVLVVLVVVIKHPADSAAFARAAAGWIGDVGDALATFGNSIAA